MSYEKSKKWSRNMTELNTERRIRITIVIKE